MTVSNQASTLSVSLPSEREIRLSRDFDAPRALLFEAFSKPEHVARWWGPLGTTLAVCELDFRPGGAWRYVTRDADGNEFGFRGQIREIVRPERIVQTFEFEGMPGHVSVETLTLEELEPGNRTRVTVTSLFDSTADRDGMLSSGMERGAAETYSRLAEYVATIQAQSASSR